MDKEEFVARLLKPFWYSHGRISAESFALRPRLREDYISVLRTSHVSFFADLCSVCRNGMDCSYACMNVAEIEKLNVAELLPNQIKYVVSAVDNGRLKSHAGIFVQVNGELLVVGKPLTSLMECGKAQSTALLLVQLKLARLAERNVKHVSLSASNLCFLSEPIYRIEE